MGFVSTEGKAGAFLRLLDFFPTGLRQLAIGRRINLRAVGLDVDSMAKLRFAKDLASDKLTSESLQEVKKFVEFMRDVFDIHFADKDSSTLSHDEIDEFERVLLILSS